MDAPFRGTSEPAQEQMIPAKERSAHSTAGTVLAQLVAGMILRSKDMLTMIGEGGGVGRISRR